jgi:chromosome segregation ATPase
MNPSQVVSTLENRNTSSLTRYEELMNKIELQRGAIDRKTKLIDKYKTEISEISKNLEGNKTEYRWKLHEINGLNTKIDSLKSEILDAKKRIKEIEESKDYDNYMKILEANKEHQIIRALTPYTGSPHDMIPRPPSGKPPGRQSRKVLILNGGKRRQSKRARTRKNKKTRSRK